MSILEKLYRSKMGYFMSLIARKIAFIHKPFMVYGYCDYPSKSFRKYTRISSTVTVMNKEDLSMGECVWVWHYSILDATEGLEIGNGCQVGAWVGIFTHGSENSIRLLGNDFVNIENRLRRCYTRGKVKIGEFTFIGARSIILPGVTIGKGCLISAGSLITKDVPDYSLVVGTPGKIVGSTLEIDKKLFLSDDYSSTYYDKEALKKLK
jgi:acetyltransferase-like isoleucine patch superfamily enzyme